ncbi:hypothetical protein ACSBR2_035971 [Camellia fascicularis]
MSAYPIKYCCMVMRMNIDCNGCYRKLRSILLNMKEIETHLIEKQHCRVSVCGRFRPSDVTIKIRKKMKRRVEILDIQEESAGTGFQGDVGQNHHMQTQQPTTSHFHGS